MADANPKIKIRLPDGSTREVARGSTLRQVAEGIGPRLAKDAVAALVNAVVIDLGRRLEGDADVRFLLERDAEALEVLRHSSSHLMAHAITRRFPEAKFGVGPAIEQGFYYDIDISRPLVPEDLAAIEQEMQRISKEDFPIVRLEWPRDQALKWAKEKQDQYKLELIEGIPEGEPISLYQQGEFMDLCTGPHLPSTGRIKNFKLLNIAGAYWRGDEHRPMMQRIYGTAFYEAGQLEQHLHWLEEAEKRDHRKLGKELELFFFHPLAPASPFFLPKGALIYNLLIQYIRELYQEFGFQEVVTPQIFQSDLWKISGHYDHYKDNMYFCMAEDREYGVKPMNCPGHMLLFASKVRSYRELPLRIADFGRLHRFERSGVTRGLTRVRSFSQDDAHVFLAPESIGAEVNHNFRLLHRIHEDLGLPLPKVLFGTRPKASVGDDALWENAERALREVLEERKEDYQLNPGDGAFYGPKIDFVTKDAIGREWQLSTIQLDFNFPERFDLKYSAADGTIKRPVVIHRAILGSLERFLGVYLEHTAGAMPLWLAPVQVKVLSVGTDVSEYAHQVGARLRGERMRVEVDDRPEKIGAKIRTGTLEKVPYLLVVGARERDSGAVAVRERAKGDQGALPFEEFLTRISREASTRRSA